MIDDTRVWFVNGRQVRVACRYVLSKGGLLKFDFPNCYDQSRELIIDPTLVFATFSGSSATTYGFSATYDTAGCLYAGVPAKKVKEVSQELLEGEINRIANNYTFYAGWFADANACPKQ